MKDFKVIVASAHFSLILRVRITCLEEKRTIDMGTKEKGTEGTIFL